MADHRIRYTQDAIDDLDIIFNYIVLQDPGAALAMLDEIEGRIVRLSQHPHMGAAIPANDFSVVQQGYRYIVVSPYLVFYRVEQDKVRIGRILHSRQDWLFLLFGLKDK